MPAQTDGFLTIFGGRRGRTISAPETTPLIFYGYSDDQILVEGELEGCQQYDDSGGRARPFRVVDGPHHMMVYATYRNDGRWIFRCEGDAPWEHKLYDPDEYDSLEALYAACGLGPDHPARNDITPTEWLRLDVPLSARVVDLQPKEG